MGQTVNWMRDKIPHLTKELKLYYDTFNNLYYNHRKPTEEHCRILGITMDQAKEIIKESNAIENGQRSDCQNYSIPNYSHSDTIENYEKITNRKRILKQNWNGIDE